MNLKENPHHMQYITSNKTNRHKQIYANILFRFFFRSMQEEKAELFLFKEK